MASLDSLNDGQRAILQLLLRQGKSYDELAALLKSDLVNVRMRARDAVAALVDDGDELGVDWHRGGRLLAGGRTAAPGRRAAR